MTTTQSAVPLPDRSFQHLPAAMRAAPRWLLWRSLANRDKSKKPRKVPFYADGEPRQGALDTPADVARLVTFEEAEKVLRGGNFTGLGFALGPDGHGSFWQGVDLDGTDVRPELAALAEKLPGYVEVSPSGKGVHAIGRGASFPSLGSNASGIEAYAAGRYFTVTGEAIRGELEDLAGFVTGTLAPLHAKASSPRSPSGAVAPLAGDSFFARVNTLAMSRLGDWVPQLFPKARPYHDGFRIESAALGRDLEEAISILPAGIRDFGEECGKSPIDLVVQWSEAANAREAALWLCRQMGVDPATQGWIERSARPSPVQGEASGPNRGTGAEAPRAGKTRPETSADLPGWAEPPPGWEGTATAREEPWPEPSDVSSPADALPYPLPLFPAVAQLAIREYAAFGRQPLPLVASSALGQMALAAQGLADVARNEHLRSPCSLYLLAVAQSGERKSAADKQFSRAIRAWVRREREDRADEFRRSVAMAKDHKARMSGVESKIKTLSGKVDDEEAGKELERLQARLIELEQNPIVAKPLPSPTHEDVNPASLAFAVASGWPSSGLFSDEAGAVIGSPGLGEENATSLLSLLNILWDGRDFTPTRKQATVAELRGRRFSAFLMLQPDLLPKLIDKGARNIGFLARFLICHPDSTMGTRLYREPPESWTALEAFDRQILSLLELPLPIDCSGEDRGAMMRLDPSVMHLDPAAKQTWIGFHDAIERELCDFGEFASVRDVASKTAENACRIAAVFKLFDQGRVGKLIESSYMEAGIAVAGWHLNEARRLFLEIDTPPETLDARELSAWLSGKARELADRHGEPIMDREGGVSLRDISKYGPNRVRETVRRDDALDILAEANHLRRCDAGKQKRIQVNPKLLTPQ